MCSSVLLIKSLCRYFVFRNGSYPKISVLIHIGTELVCYESPRPALGIHRLVFLLFQQLGRQTVYAPGWRQNFSTRGFAELYNLGSPVAAVYFNCQRESGTGGRRMWTLDIFSEGHIGWAWMIVSAVIRGTLIVIYMNCPYTSTNIGVVAMVRFAFHFTSLESNNLTGRLALQSSRYPCCFGAWRDVICNMTLFYIFYGITVRHKYCII